MSLALTASVMVAAAVEPALTCGSVLAGVRFQTVVVKPLSRRRVAIAEPMAPRPRTVMAGAA